jgi:hypothetical protein
MDRYLQAHFGNLQANVQRPYFEQIICPLGEAYVAAIAVMPRIEAPLIFGRFMLICDKSMRTAAMLIASCQPEDSVGITRRALECAKTALAIKLDNANVANWLSQEERLARWAARQEGRRPKTFRVDLDGVRGDSLIDQLGDMIGILSDASVHFTPEFYGNLAWELNVDEGGHGGHIMLNYFHTSDREIERHFLSLAAAHGLMLNAFDRCTDGKLAQDASFNNKMNRFWRISKQFNDAYRERYPDSDETQSAE